jgi:hypothetical protein
MSADMAAIPIAPVRSKRCACGCGSSYPITSFGKNCQSKDGLHYYSKKCAAKRQQRWSKANPETVRSMRADYLKRMKALNAERDPYV